MQTNVIKIPARRLEQLKAIGGELGLSVADTVAHMIRKEIAAGTIPASLPGITVEKVTGGVKVAIDDGEARVMNQTDALAFAAAIRSAIAGEPRDILGMTPGGQTDYAVLRRGVGLKIIVPFPGLDNSFSVDLARDFADLVEKAAA